MPPQGCHGEGQAAENGPRDQEDVRSAPAGQGDSGDVHLRVDERCGEGVVPYGGSDGEAVRGRVQAVPGGRLGLHELVGLVVDGQPGDPEGARTNKNVNPGKVVSLGDEVLWSSRL